MEVYEKKSEHKFLKNMVGGNLQKVLWMELFRRLVSF